MEIVSLLEALAFGKGFLGMLVGIELVVAVAMILGGYAEIGLWLSAGRAIAWD